MGHQRIGSQADKINFQQTIIHSLTILVIIIFTPHEKWHDPPMQETQETKDKTTLIVQVVVIIKFPFSG